MVTKELRDVIGGLDSTISSNLRTYRKEFYGSNTVLCELVDIDNLIRIIQIQADT